MIEPVVFTMFMFTCIVGGLMAPSCVKKKRTKIVKPSVKFGEWACQTHVKCFNVLHTAQIHSHRFITQQVGKALAVMYSVWCEMYSAEKYTDCTTRRSWHVIRKTIRAAHERDKRLIKVIDRIWIFQWVALIVGAGVRKCDGNQSNWLFTLVYSSAVRMSVKNIVIIWHPMGPSEDVPPLYKSLIIWQLNGAFIVPARCIFMSPSLCVC